ncbi:flagellar protein MotX, partial [Vibrio xuii]
MKLKQLAASVVLAASTFVVKANGLQEIGEPVPIYSEAELIRLVND